MTTRVREETIVAVSSPPGRGAISLLRMSGADSLTIASSVFKPRTPGKKLSPFLPTVGHVFNGNNEPLDEVVVTYFRAPRSFTGEDVVEISCHGSPVVVRAVLESLVAHGAQLAEPGEFSLRAFFHGKMDLSQAEGIRDMIAAQTRGQADLARRQMEGSLSARLAPAKARLIDIIVQLETAVEFVEEPVTPRGRAAIAQELDQLAAELAHLSASFETGRLLREGWLVALAGRPNVGKSSLFNRLLSEERAIVTDIPGTTRDTISETIDLEGVPVTFVDTAGLRRARGRVEEEGVRRSVATVADAHVVLMVLDAAAGWTPGDARNWSRLAGKRVLAVWSKVDLLPEGGSRPEAPPLHGISQCFVSAKTGDGIDVLKQAIVREAIPQGTADDDLIITSLRHRDCLDRTVTALNAARSALSNGLSEEFAVADLRRALDALGEITGETLIEDILQKIFSQFCIGK